MPFAVIAIASLMAATPDAGWSDPASLDGGSPPAGAEPESANPPQPTSASSDPSLPEPPPDSGTATETPSEPAPANRTSHAFAAEPAPEPQPPPSPTPPPNPNLRIGFFFAGGLFLGTENEVHVGGGANATYRIAGDLCAGVEADLMLIGGTVLPTAGVVIDYAPRSWFVSAGAGTTLLLPRSSATPGLRTVAFAMAGLKSPHPSGARLGIQARWVDLGTRNIGILVTLGRVWAL